MKDASLLETPPPKLKPSPLRAWLYVVRASWQRQARAQLMFWIAAGLVLFLTLMVALTTPLGVWDVRTWRRSGANSPTISEWNIYLRFAPRSVLVHKPQPELFKSGPRQSDLWMKAYQKSQMTQDLPPE